MYLDIWEIVWHEERHCWENEPKDYMNNNVLNRECEHIPRGLSKIPVYLGPGVSEQIKMDRSPYGEDVSLQAAGSFNFLR